MAQAALNLVEITENRVSPMNGIYIMELSNLTRKTAWDRAIDCVEYPVQIVPLKWDNPVTGEIELAHGMTDSYRDTQHFGIAVDRNRTGEFGVISTVTGTYGTLPAHNVYKSLRDELIESKIPHQPKSVYVSGNGGRQVLNVRIDGMVDAKMESQVNMVISLQTSVDGKKNHSVRVSVWNPEKKHEVIGLTGEDFSVSTKHTRTIDERHTAMVYIIEKLVKDWNETIMPMLAFMNDYKFERKAVLDIMESLLESSDIPVKHVEGAVNAIRGNGDRTFFGMLDTMSGYFHDELGESKPERMEFFRKNINKNVKKLFNKLKLESDRKAKK